MLVPYKDIIRNGIRPYTWTITIVYQKIQVS